MKIAACRRVATTAASAAIPFRCRGEELVNRETHLVEQITGIFACGRAFLVRHTIVVYRHQHLHIANKLYDGKDTKRHHNDATIGTINEVAAVAVTQLRRDAAAVAAVVVATVTTVYEPCIQHNRLGNLHTAVRHVAGRHFLTVALVGAVFAMEHAHVSFTAVENNLFAEDADALHGGARHAVPAVHLDLYVKVEGQITGIIAAVERQCLHVYVGRNNFRLLGANAVCVIDNHLITLGEEQPHVFYTVFITTPDKREPFTVLPSR